MFEIDLEETDNHLSAPYNATIGNADNNGVRSSHVVPLSVPTTTTTSPLSEKDRHVWPHPIEPTSTPTQSYTLWQAVAANDLDGLKLLLADGNHIDERNDVGATRRTFVT